MNPSTFSQQEAEILIAMAQNAPLKNMREASELSAMLGRFKTWYQHVTELPPSTKPARKSKDSSTAPPSDPAS